MEKIVSGLSSRLSSLSGGKSDLSWKLLRVVDLWPLIICMSFVSRLVFWLGLLYFNLPGVCAEPAPGEAGGGGGGVDLLLGGRGPSRSLTDNLGDAEGAGEGCEADVLQLGVVPSLSRTGTLGGEEGGRDLGTSRCWAVNL